MCCLSGFLVVLLVKTYGPNLLPASKDEEVRPVNAMGPSYPWSP